MHELTLAWRRLRRHPGVTAASVATLAIAAGVAAATWSLLSAVLLHPLPVREPDSLRIVGAQRTSGPQAGPAESTFVYPYYTGVRDSGAFDSVAAGWLSALPLPVNEQRPPQATRVVFVTANFFDVLGVPVVLGRGFTADDDRRGAPPVAVLSDRYWRTTFDADPAVLGRPITVAGKSVTIVGIAPRGFRGLSLAHDPAMYVPLETIADVGPSAYNFFGTPGHSSSPTAGITIIGRLPQGATAEQIAARLEGLFLADGRYSALTLADINTAAIPAAAREGMSRFAQLLAWTVGLLLLIGCSTVGLLLLVRTEARRAEFATCLALGATRAQLASGIVLEGALVATAAAAAAPLIAVWLFSAVSTFQLPGGIDLGLLDLALDSRALAVCAGSALLGVVLIAVTAGLTGFKADLADALRLRGGATPRVTRRPARALLLVTQVAVAVTLVAGTGLFARSLRAALALNERLDSSRIVTMDVPLMPGEDAPERAAAFYDELLTRLDRNPAVASVATTFSTGGMGPGGRVTIDGMPREFPTLIPFRYVDEAYFRTMRMRLLQGREFSPQDSAAAPQVAIVSESFGRMIGAGASPLGRHIAVVFGGQLDMEIVGVVEDVFTSIRVAEPLALYLPITQSRSPLISRTLVFRAAHDADAARREALGVIRDIDSNLRPAAGLTLDERLLREMAPQQFGMFVLGTLGVVALLLTLLGTYVIAETMAATRTREMGIRAALGASGGRLIGLMVRDTAALVTAGLVAGVLLAWIGASTIRAFLFRVQPLDPVTLGSVAAVMLLLSVAVSLRPALRAARVDLASVLRVE